MPAAQQDREYNWTELGLERLLTHLQVRFNVLRVLPKTGRSVKGFSKF